MNSKVLSLIILFSVYAVFSYSKNNENPLFSELSSPISANPIEWNSTKGTNYSWGSTAVRYEKHSVPTIKRQNIMMLAGWKGEKVNVQAVVWTKDEIESLNYELTVFKNNKGVQIPANAFSSGFVRYVMTDELNKDKKGACGDRPDRTLFDSLLVADAIDHKLKAVKMDKMSVRPIWISCTLPLDLQKGVYKGELIIKNGNTKIGRLKLEIDVSEKKLPTASNQRFHLDLWQNPFSVARIENVSLWSDAHFEAMRPVMKQLAEAGQKVITTSIIHKPWNGQTEDYFESMITWMKKVDGTWYYDYTIFDRWVEFMMQLGIDKQINCYTMVPWALNFKYYDQATNSIQSIQTKPGEKEYEDLWLPFLRSFAQHLKEKGWFQITTIAMDERPMEVMLKTIEIIKKADSDFLISLAGHKYEAEIEPYIHDYSISLSQSFPNKVLERRGKENKKSTYYISCTHSHPNTFTFSDPDETVWLGFYLAKDNVDGLLRWAYNSWVKDPLLDSRFRSWAGGDTYLVYPERRSSIRFEKLIEGIQIYEKIIILKTEFSKTNNIDGLNKIDKLLSLFNLKDFPAVSASQTVDKAKKLLNTM